MKFEIYFSNKEISVFLVKELVLFNSINVEDFNPIIEIKTMNDICLSYDLNSDRYYCIKLDDVKFYEYLGKDDLGNKIEFIKGRSK